jgi:hypothetical protein
MKSLIRHLPVASSIDPYGLGLFCTIAYAVLVFGMLKLREVFRRLVAVRARVPGPGSHDAAQSGGTRGLPSAPTRNR